MDEDCLRIEFLCQRLSIAFAIYADRNDADRVSQLFLEDGQFSRPGMVLKGAGQIRGFLRERPPERVTRHVCANILVDVEGPEHATGITYFTLFEGMRTDTENLDPLEMQLPLTMGEYHDTYQKSEKGWRIAERRAVPVFRRA